MKKFIVLVLTGIVAAWMLVSSGCVKKVSNDENTLELFTVEAGYGKDWLNQAAALFSKQEWVREKYPELQVVVTSSYDTGAGITRVSSGGNANTADLVFSTQPGSAHYSKTDESGNYYYADLTEIYESEVPGENVKFKNKMIPKIYQEYQSRRADGTPGYFGIPWINGFMGICINKTAIANNLGADYVLPKTTDKLVEMCKDLKLKGIYANFPTSNYWHSMFVVWWAQYEGIENYTDFWNGVDENGEYTAQIFLQQGRLESLSVLENLLLRSHGYWHPKATSADYTTAQAFLFQGEVAMQANGDWIEKEMETVKPNGELTMMKTPVISAITDKCSSVVSDEELEFVVGEVDKQDENASYGYADAAAAFQNKFNKELKEDDFILIKNARSMMYRLEGHDVYLPAYATAIEPAKDFLRFLATDTAIETLMEYTGGVSPYLYDVQVKNPSLYNSFSTMQQDHIDHMKNGIQIPSFSSFPLNYYGGLLPLTQNADISGKFMSQNEADRNNAYGIYMGEYNYFHENGETLYKAILKNAGFIA